ncbi:MAG TPA: glycosyltransferase family 2 protein [Pyrinomonadaceae bacterium]|jgi:GT2 family glycosyltransferase|nr:glycosyltransferase family 2 protein [Pyrinomonadaceae bacterium]
MPETDAPLVYIVVLHWRDDARTAPLLKSLQEISYSNFRVLVVDNCSQNGSVERLQSQFPASDFISNEANLGFSRGCNRGIRVALERGSDYVVLLNNDMQVEPDFLEAAVAAGENDRTIGLVTGKILFGDRRNVIWQAGGRIDGFKIQGIPRGWNEIDEQQFDQEENTFWASGAMLLIPRRTLETVGLLPEEYFFGVEEWDYSTAVRKAGLAIRYVPRFKGYHHAGASYKAGDPVLIVYNGIRNKLVYAEKYLSPPAWVVWKIMFRCYLALSWPKKARWGCETEDDYQARLKAARLAFADHRGIERIELADLQSAAKVIGPTPTWGDTWLALNGHSS